jgi:hypothetical protein
MAQVTAPSRMKIHLAVRQRHQVTNEGFEAIPPARNAVRVLDDTSFHVNRTLAEPCRAAADPFHLGDPIGHDSGERHWYKP